jgi:hypothetical protein
VWRSLVESVASKPAPFKKKLGKNLFALFFAHFLDNENV